MLWSREIYILILFFFQYKILTQSIKAKWQYDFLFFTGEKFREVLTVTFGLHKCFRSSHSNSSGSGSGQQTLTASTRHLEMTEVTSITPLCRQKVQVNHHKGRFLLPPKHAKPMRNGAGGSGVCLQIPRKNSSAFDLRKPVSLPSLVVHKSETMVWKLRIYSRSWVNLSLNCEFRRKSGNEDY